jgi:hypothetical protein
VGDKYMPLDTATRAILEPRFGYDLSRVRVHVDNDAARLAKVIHARAFTLGADVYFAAGHYAPSTRAGQQLIAHELTHVIQQHGGTVQSSTPQASFLQRAPIQSEIPAKVPTPARPTSAAPSHWTETDLEAYLAWALEIQQRPPPETGIKSGWKGLETGRAAGYLPGIQEPSAETDIVYSTGREKEFVSSEPGIASGETTLRVHTGAGTEQGRAWVELPSFNSRADLVVRAHAHPNLGGGGGLMSYDDAEKFFSENSSAGRVEFIFDQRVDLVGKPDAKISGYVYLRDGIKGALQLDALNRAYGKTAEGIVTPLTSPSALRDTFRSIEPSSDIFRFKYSVKSGFSRTPIL